MTTYKLPDGTEVASLDVNGSNIPNRVWVTHPTLGSIMIDRDKLTEVPPPLPAEPGNGFIGIAGDEVWERDDLAEQEGDAGEGEHWWRMGDTKPHTWEFVAVLAPNGLISLVPDPAVDAPSLPWVKPSNDTRYNGLRVEGCRDAGDVLVINGIRLAANQIRDLMGICARHLKPGAERDALMSAAVSARESATPLPASNTREADRG